MNKAALLSEIMQLSPDERMELVEEVWDSIADDPGRWPSTTPEQMAEINRRLEEHRRDPSSAISWEEVRERLWSRRR